ncbi:hypothetical protein LguiA_003096 [Lonicera macranthoides]
MDFTLSHNNNNNNNNNNKGWKCSNEYELSEKKIVRFDVDMNSLAAQLHNLCLLLTCCPSASNFESNPLLHIKSYLRIINFSVPNSMVEKEVEGLGMYTDMSCLTIVYQDEVGGLQRVVRKGSLQEVLEDEVILHSAVHIGT